MNLDENQTVRNRAKAIKNTCDNGEGRSKKGERGKKQVVGRKKQEERKRR